MPGIKVKQKWNPFNAQRFSRPWICKILSWEGSKIEVEWGTFIGIPRKGGYVSITVDIKDIIKTGQKNILFPDRSGLNTVHYKIVDDLTEDGLNILKIGNGTYQEALEYYRRNNSDNTFANKVNPFIWVEEAGSITTGEINKPVLKNPKARVFPTKITKIKGIDWQEILLELDPLKFTLPVGFMENSFNASPLTAQEPKGILSYINIANPTKTIKERKLSSLSIKERKLSSLSIKEFIDEVIKSFDKMILYIEKNIEDLEIYYPDFERAKEMSNRLKFLQKSGLIEKSFKTPDKIKKELIRAIEI